MKRPVRTALGVLVLGVMCLAPVTPLRAELISIASRTVPVRVECSNTAPLVRTTVQWCRRFLASRGYSTQPDVNPSADGPCDRWVLELDSDCPVARSVGLPVGDLAGLKSDAFLLSVSATNQRALVIIVGKGPVGLRSGLARLIAQLHEGDGQLFHPQTNELRDPFFAIRELVVANRGLVLQGTPHADTFWRNWSDERIRAYVEQLWLFGFNSLQVCEARNFRITPETEPRAFRIAEKIGVLAGVAHANGLLLNQLVWGLSPFNRKICWSSPTSRRVMEEEFRWMARVYAPLVDHVIVHVRDPGGCDCGQCDDYRTPQEIATFLLTEYRKYNPGITVTLSTWFNRTFWRYAPGVRSLSDTLVQFWTGDPLTPFADSNAVRVFPDAPRARFLDETFSPRQVAIALHKWYDPAKAWLVRQAGRDVDVWGWYLSDHETVTDMSQCMRRLDYYFSSLPPQAHQDVRRISTELCFHGRPQLLNAYVSACKMWSPQRPLRDTEYEFCSALFGETNAPAMVQLYEICERVAHPKRGDACVPTLEFVFGNPRFNERCRATLEAARRVVLRPERPPRWTTATPPETLLRFLERRLEMILVLSEAQERLDRARGRGAARPELAAIVTHATEAAAASRDDPLYPILMDKLDRSLKQHPDDVSPNP